MTEETPRPPPDADLAAVAELRTLADHAELGRVAFERIADAAEAHCGERRLAKSAIHGRYDKNHRRAK